MATCRCHGWSRRCRPRRRDCSGCRAARWRRRQRRPHRGRSRRAMGRAGSRHPLALQEHLFRRRAAAGQGLANHGCGPHSIFGLTGGRIDARNSGGAGFRLSAGLDPVRPAGHPRRRARRRPQDRLRQYRRHQRAAHRQQGPCRADAAARCAEGHGGGAGRPAVSAPTMRSMPASRRFSATSSRPG